MQRITLIKKKNGELECLYKPYEPVVGEDIEQVSYPLIDDLNIKVLQDIEATKDQVKDILSKL